LTKEQFIERYVEFFVKQWTKNAHDMRGLVYNDKPYSVTRLLALTTAQTIWEMREVNVDAVSTREYEL
jgi:hypothetical protein